MSKSGQISVTLLNTFQRDVVSFYSVGLRITLNVQYRYVSRRKQVRSPRQGSDDLLAKHRPTRVDVINL